MSLLCVREKKRDIFNLIIKIVQYMVSIVGVVITANFFFFFHKILSLELDMKLLAIFGESNFNSAKQTIVIFEFLRATMLVVCMGILLMLAKAISGNMEKRADSVKNLHMVGYTKKQAILYEIGFTMTDIIMSMVLAMAFSVIAIFLFEKAESISEICKSMETELLNISSCLLSSVIVIIVSIISIIAKVNYFLK